MLGILQTIENIGRIIDYSKLMLEISLKLEKALHYKGFPVIQKDYSITPSQHIWSRFNNQNECYRVFADLEKHWLRIETWSRCSNTIRIERRTHRNIS